MSIRELVYAQALVLAGELEARQEELLKLLSAGATLSLTARLRDGLTPEDCKADFVAAAGLMALAALKEAELGEDLSSLKAGDLTITRKQGDTASRCLQIQAERMMEPYLKGKFLFQGV